MTPLRPRKGGGHAKKGGLGRVGTIKVASIMGETDQNGMAFRSTGVSEF